jgi:hypothetical protein
MFRDVKMQSLFDEYDYPGNINDSGEGERISTGRVADQETERITEKGEGNQEPVTGKGAFILKIVMFYGDNSFEEYYPR